MPNRYAAIHAATRRAHAEMRVLDAAARTILIGIYRDAAEVIANRVRAAAGGNDLIGYARLQDLREQIDRILGDLEERRNAQLDANLIRAAQLGAAPWDEYAVAQSQALPISAASQRVAQDAVRFVASFIARDGLQLSDRLWRIDSGARDTIKSAIARAVVSGQGAAEAARELLSRGEPVSAGISDKMREASAARLSNQVKAQLAGEASPMTNALRLMRTEINRAHGEAFMSGAESHPDFGGHKYLLSPAHPKPDICDLLATQNLYGLGEGVYPNREATPWPAHPNTLSFIAPVFKDEVTEADREGKETEAAALARLSPERREGVLATAKQFRKDAETI